MMHRFQESFLPILIGTNKIGKHFGAKTLFEDISFVIESGERVGLIGPNGAGKSTLLRILADQVSPDGGTVSPSKGLRIGFLEQLPKLDSELTVEHAVSEGASPHGISLVAEVLSKLELSTRSELKVGTLSGGWKKRVALARELVREPDLLLLDEPTNHLDIQSILWLESFLARASFAVVVVTHDRVFLQNVTNRILELDSRNLNGLLSVQGDYAEYLTRKDQLVEIQKREQSSLANKYRRELEWLRRGPKARTTKQQARIHAAGELKENLDDLEERNSSRSVRIDFQTTEKRPKRLIEARSIVRSLGGRCLFRDLSLFIGPGSRVGLLGTNGCGKSTLIRTLIGVDSPDAGQIIRAEHLKVAYFEQNRETLDPMVTLSKTLCPHGEHVNYRGKFVHINGYLDRFLFRREQFEMVVGRLSGGEQARVLIARLMLNEADILVLDEPTNDLDVETLNVLQDCLTDFEGAVLLVTHDRYFLDQVANTILAFPEEGMEPGKLYDFADVSQWENWAREKKSAKKPAAKAEATSSAPAMKKKLSYNETRELAQMEPKIHAAEAKLKQLKGDLEIPENQSNSKRLAELCQGIAETEHEIETLYARWSYLES